MTTNDASATPEIDHLTYMDVVIARTISAALTSEVALGLAFHRLNDRGCVLFRDRAAGVVTEKWGDDGNVAMLKLTEIIDGHRQRAAFVRGQPHWLRKVISSHDRQAIIIDERGECWLGEANGHDQALSGDFDAEEVTETIACLVDATEVGYDLPPQGFVHGMYERHFGGDNVTDEQRRDLLEKLQRLRARGYTAPKKETG